MISRALRIQFTAQLNRSISIRSQIHQMASTLPKLPIFEAIAKHDPDTTSVIHSISGRRFIYGRLLSDIADANRDLHQSADDSTLNGRRIAFLVENSYDYVGATHKSGCDEIFV